MKAALDISELFVARGGSRVIRNVSLTFGRGAWTGLIGANGSGKTSLLRAISGRLPLTGGSVEIAGTDLTNARSRRAAAIGFAPPPEALPLTLNVREVLALVGQDIDAALANTADIGVALNVKGLLTKQLGACSAGMKQRVAIACAFAAGRDIVILDEPFNWLDPVAAYDLKQLLRARVDDGLTLITALHDLSSFTRLCDAGAIMVDGQVAIELDRQQLQSAEIDFVGFERRMIDLLRASKGSVSPNDSN